MRRQNDVFWQSFMKKVAKYSKDVKCCILNPYKWARLENFDKKEGPDAKTNEPIEKLSGTFWNSMARNTQVLDSIGVGYYFFHNSVLDYDILRNDTRNIPFFYVCRID